MNEDDIEEISESEIADALIEKQRHDEIKEPLDESVSFLKEISKTLSEKNDDQVIKAISGQSKAIGEFARAIQNLPKPEKPEVKVEVNQDKVVSSVDDLGKNLLEKFTLILEQLKIYNERPAPPVVDKVTITERNFEGFAKTFDFIYKK